MDKSLGMMMVTFSIVFMLYYTLWVLATPFIDDGHFLMSLFPSRYYALTIPLQFVGLALIAVAVVFLRSCH
ncbi:hypothetical protein CHUAL_006162 [Chamberlinius hualienensis]